MTTPDPDAVSPSAATEVSSAPEAAPNVDESRVVTPTRPDRIGRFVVTGTLGQGGMGIVLAAYDPELDRKVALKLVRSDRGGAEGRARLLREAQAMARLSHPNVVAVHDVGVYDGDVFVAMEFVRGRTLRAWLAEARRPWREVVGMFVQAGRGLSAAHEAALVHRDFKPDNVLVDEKERALVTDFGLARPSGRDHSQASVGVDRTGPSPLEVEVTVRGALVGTPAYMAPEQIEEGVTDARSDQFAFCVALFEAIHGARPFTGTSAVEIAGNVLRGNVTVPPGAARIPVRLRRAVLRGLAVDPAQRWSSIDELLDQLIAPTRMRRTRWVVAVVVAGAASLGTREYLTSDARACASAGEEIEAAWSPARREQVASALLAIDVPFAADTAAKVTAILDARAEAWGETRVEVCMAHRRGETAPETQERALSCLRRGRLLLDKTATLLATPDASIVEAAVRIADGLGDPRSCAEPRPADGLPAPEPGAQQDAVEGVREGLDEVRMLRVAGAYDDARSLATKVLTAARATEYEPAIVEALLTTGDVADDVGAYDEAEAVLRESYFTASGIKHEVVAAKAIGKLANVIGSRLERHADALELVPYAEVALARAGDDGATSEVLIALGNVEEAMGKLDDAREHYERALVVVEAGDPGDPDAARLLSSIALVDAEQGHYDAARTRLDRALGTMVDEFGPDHPEVARILNNIAKVELDAGRSEPAIEALQRALAIKEGVLGPDHIDLVPTLGNLATAADNVARYDDAERHATRALGIATATLGAEHPLVGVLHVVIGNAHYGRHQLDAAASSFAVALAIQRRALGDDHPDVAGTLENLGSVAREQGDLAVARARHLEALRIKELQGPENPALVTTLASLGLLAVAEGRFVEAVELTERSAAIEEKTAGESSRLATVLTTLGEALLELGRKQRALVVLDRARRLRLVATGVAGERAVTEFTWARALWAVGRRSEAIDAAHQAARDLGVAGIVWSNEREAVDEWLARARTADASSP
jgi:eukaryotic-like serine/threonine-protein kinase